MNYRTMGRTGWQVSEISLGGAGLVGADPERSQDNVCALVERAFDLGINYFDTAPIYGGTLSEELLGNALASVSRPFYLATKVGYDPEDFDYRSDSVLWSLERSLQRLRVPKLSLAQFHDNQASWERITEPGGTLEGLRAAQQRGRCEYIGVTGRAVPLLVNLVQKGAFDVVLVYHDYQPCRQVAAERLSPAAHAHAMGIVVGSVLAGGLFGHASQREALLARMGQQQRETTSKVIELLRTEPGTLAQNAFRYVLADPRVSTVPSGARCVSELDDVARATDLGPLAPELIEALHELS